ncbi:exodeoxyribonuclease V subunit alpha [Ectothiorhodospiraceae bacterium BW-2]|nr:exodeoxyribonuclease V subunit alpha [Ectothiorhodospiraceae bacterium BW-2]
MNALPQLQQHLADWVKQGVLRQLDLELLYTLDHLAPEPEPLVWLTTAIVSALYGEGHSSVSLTLLSGQPDALLGVTGSEVNPLPSQLLQGVTPESLQQQLLKSRWCSTQGEAPLTLAGERCYLTRLYRAEALIRTQIGQRLTNAEPVDHDKLNATLAQLFQPQGEESAPDWQKLAVVLALQRRFMIVTGGPGTGKTTTVTRLLAALQQLADKPLHIALAAPTGKAAARLNESMAGALAQLPAGWADSLPRQAQTLHRLLGVKLHHHSFRHHAGRPLVEDVIVVDEASMVDLELMAALMAALKPTARLILLGDKDQLASVEAGAVLGDLCRGAEAGNYSAVTIAQLQPFSDSTLTPWQGEGSAMNQATVMLRHSYRFTGAIGELAIAVNRGEGETVLAQLRQAQQLPDSPIHWVQPTDPGDPQLRRQIMTQLKPFLARIDPTERCDDERALALLQQLSRFQLLCALRQGEWGVSALNRRISGWAKAECGVSGASEWFVGRPVMVLRNNYALGVMNGDVGLTLLNRAGELRVAFKTVGDGECHNTIKWVLPGRLGEVESSYALTVHKSQGSEFNHCALLLPPKESPVLTQELFYTALTRAKEGFTLFAGSEAVIKQCVERRVWRGSGL